jgi:hypothetical protein
MSKFSAVIPLLHKECKLIPNVPLLLDETTSIRSVKSEHIGAIINKRRALSEALNSKTKCILVQTGDEEASQDFVENAALCGAFVLNIFAGAGASVCNQAFVIKYVRSHSVTNVFDLPSVSAPTPGRYVIDESVEPASVKTLYSSVKEALNKDPGLAITIRRFNGALSRQIYEDKIIDITICLESMFNSQTEISFRFILYNSLLSETDLRPRVELFRLLKKLYSERSNLVHGSKALDTAWTAEHWDSLVRVAKLCLLKKIEFLQDHPIGSWQNHLDGLALGAQFHAEEN